MAFVFEPPSSDLKVHAFDVQAAIAAYDATTDAGQKQQALGKICAAAQGLSRIATHPGQFMSQIVFQPQANASIRLAAGMGLFDHLTPGESATTEELAKRCNADPELVMRIARAVACQGVLREVGEDTYAHGYVSMMLRDDNAKAGIAHMYDNVAVTMFYLNDYFKQNGWKSPADIQNTPTVFARGYKDMGYWEYLTKFPETLSVFNKAMAFVSMTGADGIADTFPWSSLEPGHEGVTVIDVGGGKGHALQSIMAKHPGIAGHAVLEDLENVLADGTMVDAKDVRSQPYNFLEQEQPVVGASAYYFRHVLCDWPDHIVEKILGYQLKAMKGYNSKLLISDLVLENQGVDLQKAMRDINMMQVSGVERSEKQWHAILDRSGFKIVQIHHKADPYNAVIEAIPKA